jgi:putative FmdB family regulatory protein
MPIYEYKCRACGQTFEVLQSFSDAPLTKHDGCGGPVEKLLSPPALQFKGTGWYITDYARAGSTSAEAKDGKSTESKVESKTESKAEPSGLQSAEK